MLINEINIDFIDLNVVVLTPNHRLAAFLHTCYQQKHVNAGKKIWNTPAIYSINTWLEILYKDFGNKKLLTSFEQQIIWEQIIIDSKYGDQLLRVSSSAKQARDAWNILLQWELDFSKLELKTDSNAEVFLEWATKYKKLCKKNDWLDFPSMVNFLNQAILNDDIILPDKCYLIECNDLTPQYKKLFTNLKSRNILICKAGKDPVVIGLASKENEYLTAAYWAKQQWEQDPDKRIGIVVPDLTSCRDYIEQVFAATFSAPVYNISAPNSIASYPLIAVALLILKNFNNKFIELETLTQLLRTPFIGGADLELTKRASFDCILRLFGESLIKIENILQEFDKLAIDHSGKCNDFITRFKNWLFIFTKLKGKHSTDYWTNKFKEILIIWGWPGERKLNEQEYELFVCWELLLQSYQKLGHILGLHDFHKAQLVLKQLALETPFLPKSGDVPIHVLGTLEAVGLPFDLLWVTGMDREAWPLKPMPNPFIPMHIQRQYNLPHSSPQRELAFAKQLTEAFSRGGKTQVIFSFPIVVDEVKTDLSRLLVGYKVITNFNLNVDLLKYKSIKMEQFIDDKAPEFSSNLPVPGGSKVLKLQAACPFWAFAEIRLGAIAIFEPTIGLTPAERGTLLHAVLAEFWQQVNTLECLNKMSTDDIKKKLLLLINNYLNNLQRKRPITLNKNYINIETKRMLNIINLWLNIERQRSPFVVFKLEQQKLITLGTITFKIRIDRIDKLLTGEIIIIDYKTGRVKLSQIFGDRLQEPQLPLYCLALEEVPSEVAFAVIRPDQIALQEQAVNWNDHIIPWQSKLGNLAQEFQQGVAVVNPLQGTVTCRICNLQPFCRVYENA